jgi:hypothetical protein
MQQPLSETERTFPKAAATCSVKISADWYAHFSKLMTDARLILSFLAISDLFNPFPFL